MNYETKYVYNLDTMFGNLTGFRYLISNKPEWEMLNAIKKFESYVMEKYNIKFELLEWLKNTDCDNPDEIYRMLEKASLISL
jgi:hypothetical protein